MLINILKSNYEIMCSLTKYEEPAQTPAQLQTTKSQTIIKINKQTNNNNNHHHHHIKFVMCHM